MPAQWFDTDAETDEVRSFTVYRDEDGKVLPHPELRDFWVACIKPVYANNKGRDPVTMPLLHYYDTKSNPRRIHPFAVVYYEWCEKVYQGLNPVCLMRPCVLPVSLCFNYREGLPDHLIRFQEYSTHDGLPRLIRLQSWWRRMLAVEEARRRRMDPENLFALAPKSRECYVRLVKAGIDVSTYDTMSAPPPAPEDDRSVCSVM